MAAARMLLLICAGLALAAAFPLADERKGVKGIKGGYSDSAFKRPFGGLYGPDDFKFVPMGSGSFSRSSSSSWTSGGASESQSSSTSFASGAGGAAAGSAGSASSTTHGEDGKSGSGSKSDSGSFAGAGNPDVNIGPTSPAAPEGTDSATAGHGLDSDVAESHGHSENVGGSTGLGQHGVQDKPGVSGSISPHPAPGNAPGVHIDTGAGNSPNGNVNYPSHGGKDSTEYNGASVISSGSEETSHGTSGPLPGSHLGVIPCSIGSGCSSAGQGNIPASNEGPRHVNIGTGGHSAGRPHATSGVVSGSARDSNSQSSNGGYQGGNIDYTPDSGSHKETGSVLNDKDHSFPSSPGYNTGHVASPSGEKGDKNTPDSITGIPQTPYGINGQDISGPDGGPIVSGGFPQGPVAGNTNVNEGHGSASSSNAGSSVYGTTGGEKHLPVNTAGSGIDINKNTGHGFSGQGSSNSSPVNSLPIQPSTSAPGQHVPGISCTDVTQCGTGTDSHIGGNTDGSVHVGHTDGHSNTGANQPEVSAGVPSGNTGSGVHVTFNGNTSPSIISNVNSHGSHATDSPACSGSGGCRPTHAAGPNYQGTHNIVPSTGSPTIGISGGHHEAGNNGYGVSNSPVPGVITPLDTLPGISHNLNKETGLATGGTLNGNSAGNTGVHGGHTAPSSGSSVIIPSTENTYAGSGTINNAAGVTVTSSDTAVQSNNGGHGSAVNTGSHQVNTDSATGSPNFVSTSGPTNVHHGTVLGTGDLTKHTDSSAALPPGNVEHSTTIGGHSDHSGGSHVGDVSGGSGHVHSGAPNTHTAGENSGVGTSETSGSSTSIGHRPEHTGAHPKDTGNVYPSSGSSAGSGAAGDVHGSPAIYGNDKDDSSADGIANTGTGLSSGATTSSSSSSSSNASTNGDGRGRSDDDQSQEKEIGWEFVGVKGRHNPYPRRPGVKGTKGGSRSGY